MVIDKKFRQNLSSYIKKHYKPEQTNSAPMSTDSIVFSMDNRMTSFIAMPAEEKRQPVREHRKQTFGGPKRRKEDITIQTQGNAFRTVEARKPLRTENKIPKWLENSLTPTFQQKLFSLIDEKDMRDADVYKAAQIDKRLFSKIRSDEEYSPSKNTVIQLCFGLKLEVDHALDLLSSAGYTLSFSKMEDVIVRYFLEEENYDLIELNVVLYEYDLKPLFQ